MGALYEKFTWKRVCFCKIYMKVQIHTCFHVFSVPHLPPPPPISVKGLLCVGQDQSKDGYLLPETSLHCSVCGTSEPQGVATRSVDWLPFHFIAQSVALMSPKSSYQECRLAAFPLHCSVCGTSEPQGVATRSVDWLPFHFIAQSVALMSPKE